MDGLNLMERQNLIKKYFKSPQPAYNESETMQSSCTENGTKSLKRKSISSNQPILQKKPKFEKDLNLENIFVIHSKFSTIEDQIIFDILEMKSEVGSIRIQFKKENYFLMRDYCQLVFEKLSQSPESIEHFFDNFPYELFDENLDKNFSCKFKRLSVNDKKKLLLHYFGYLF